MKNYLVILVTVGIGAAYWYQMPEPPKPKEEVAAVTPPPAPVVRTFTPSHTALEDPAAAVGTKKAAPTSVLLGNDKPSHLHP